MNATALPQTVNLHSLAACNYRCGFCYAGFASARRPRIPPAELHDILRQIGSAPRPDGGPRKITFAGGEPLLSTSVIDDLTVARQQGLLTSLVTNGSLLTADLIGRLAPVLDWLTISIDSVDEATNRRIGRAVRGVTVSAGEHLARIQAAQELGIRVKLNTVVNQANATEDFTAFIRAARPRRWKLFQATRIAEENGERFDLWAVTEAAFHDFVARHAGLAREGVILVPETQADIYGTYAMVAPNGCFFDNALGTYRYSQPIVRVGIQRAWSEISFSPERFRGRGGDYDLQTGRNRGEVAL